MRHIATLADGEAARAFADYLLTLKIETRLDQQPDGWDLWICDEDRVEQAREELAEFNRNPTDPRYAQAGGIATTLRRTQAEEEDRYRRRQQSFQRRMDRPEGGRPITIFLMAVSILVGVASSLGSDREVLRWLFIVPIYKIQEINAWIPETLLDGLREGQVWRLVTPIFIHFGIIHLVFNMSMLYSLGGRLESLLGSVRYLLLVLVLGVVSNLAQYYLGHIIFEGGYPVLVPSPGFGGMSGVLYGLFGYVVVRYLWGRDERMAIDRNSIFILMLWFVLCWAGVLGNIANMAHTGGLLLGGLIGFLPELWRLGKGE
jgi:GlpG protein